MKNSDVVVIGLLVIFFVAIWAIMKHAPAMHFHDRPSPLPSGLATNGAPSVEQSNNVAQRVNFQEQPYG